MEEKRISAKEFDDAVQAVMTATFDDPKLEGTSGIIVTMAGMMFASHMREILFKEETKND